MTLANVIGISHDFAILEGNNAKRMKTHNVCDKIVAHLTYVSAYRLCW